MPEIKPTEAKVSEKVRELAEQLHECATWDEFWGNVAWDSAEAHRLIQSSLRELLEAWHREIVMLRRLRLMLSESEKQILDKDTALLSKWEPPV